MSKDKIIFKNKVIEYKLIRKNVKNINLRVKPSLEVIVSANKSVSKEYIHKFIKSKASWIYKHLEKFEKIKSNYTKKEFISGEYFSYLGKKYKLIVRNDEKNKMKFYRGKLYIYVEDLNNYKLKKSIYNKWLKERANIIFKEILDKMYEKIKSFDVKYPKMTIRNMKTRWGSCNSVKSKINMNLNLIKANKKVIEYVIMHELVHLIHSNHSKKFYDLLELLIPDYKSRESLLNQKIMNKF